MLFYDRKPPAINSSKFPLLWLFASSGQLSRYLGWTLRPTSMHILVAGLHLYVVCVTCAPRWFKYFSNISWPHSHLNLAIHNLPHFRVSSKHVAGSISKELCVFAFNVVPLSKQIWPKTWPLNFWAIIWDRTWQLNTLGSNLQARSSGTSYLSNTALVQTHRPSSMASSWLNFLEQ